MIYWLLILIVMSVTLLHKIVKRKQKEKRIQMLIDLERIVTNEMD